MKLIYFLFVTWWLNEFLVAAVMLCEMLMTMEGLSEFLLVVERQYEVESERLLEHLAVAKCVMEMGA